MPRVRKYIFSRFFYMRYILVVRVSSWNVEKVVALNLNPKFPLSVKNATSVQKKRKSLTGYFLVRALSLRNYMNS